jgi:hypothetical protein
MTKTAADSAVGDGPKPEAGGAAQPGAVPSVAAPHAVK